MWWDTILSGRTVAAGHGSPVRFRSDGYELGERFGFVMTVGG